MSIRPHVVGDGLAFPEGPLVGDDDSVLVSEMAAGRITRVGTDGSTSLHAHTGGGPNGLGQLPDGRVIVCQNGGSTFGVRPWPLAVPGGVPVFLPTGPLDEPLTPQLQIVSADGAVSTLTTTFVATDGRTLPLGRPSDVCVDRHGGFYVTDAGATHDRRRQITGVLYGTLDEPLREILYPLEMPNGVALSPDGERLYVAETRTRRLWELTLDEPGTIGRARTLATVPSGGPLDFGGADGVCVDDDGLIVVATIGAGGATVFDPGGRLLGEIPADDPITTNVAVANSGSRLYMTLASSGRLLAVDRWRDALR